MKTLVLFAFALPLVGCTAVTRTSYSPAPPPHPVVIAPTPPPADMVLASPSTSVPPAPTETTVVTTTSAMAAPTGEASFTDAQLDVLLGPIALYPDALIALILPASTAIPDLVLAARYVRGGSDLAQIEAQPWEESVRALAHYGEVVKWMDDNLAWTKQLGDAFATQPASVMNTIQRLRAQARAAGTLVDTTQQRVVVQERTILIVPTQPDVIYVPYYDPLIVYAPPRTYYSRPSGSFFNFSTGFAVGAWMSFGVDWRDRCVWSVHRNDRDRYWREHRNDWHRHYQPPHRVTSNWRPAVHTWQPRPHHRSGPSFGHRPTQTVGQPSTPRPAESSRDTRETWRNHRGGDRNSHNPPPSRGPAYSPPSEARTRTVDPMVNHQRPAPIVSQTPALPRQEDQRRERGNNRGRGIHVEPSPAHVVVAPPQMGPTAPPYGRGATPPSPSRAAPAPRPAPPMRVHAAPPPPPPAAEKSAPAENSSPQERPQPQPEDQPKRPPFVRMR